MSVTNPDDGTGLAGEVAVVNGGFLLEQDRIEDGLIILEDSSSDQLVMEAQTNSGTNDITKIKITNKGGGYLSLPTVTVSSTSGSSATVFPVSSEVGNLLGFKILDQGFRYEEAPVLNPKVHMQIDNLSGTFTVGETVTAEAEDNLTLESFEPLDFPILLEDFRHPVLRAEDDHGDLITEDGDSFAQEEFVSPAVFDETTNQLVSGNKALKIQAIPTGSKNDQFVFGTPGHYDYLGMLAGKGYSVDEEHIYFTADQARARNIPVPAGEAGVTIQLKDL